MIKSTIRREDLLVKSVLERIKAVIFCTNDVKIETIQQKRKHFLSFVQQKSEWLDVVELHSNGFLSELETYITAKIEEVKKCYQTPTKEA